MTVMDELASQQLSALARVDAHFTEADLAYWLFGGWAVDFHVGSVTRAHDDIDVAVWLDELPRIVALLEADGWRHAPHADEDGGTGYERGVVRLELTFLVRDSDGAVFTPLAQGRIPWPAGALADEVRSLNGVRARLMGLEGMTAWKSSPRDEPDDGDKDRADFARLSRLALR